MEVNGLGKYTISFGLSLAITCVLSALLVVAKELNEGLLDWMKHVTPHHWITHGVFNILAFVIIGFVIAQVGGAKGTRQSTKGFIMTLVGAVVISGLIIPAFYLIHG